MLLGYEQRFVARALAWPLVGAPAFERGPVALARESGVFDGPTYALYDALEGDLARGARGASLDSIREIVTGAWFGASPATVRVDLATHLRRIADEYLVLDGPELTIRAADARDVDAASTLLDGAGREMRIRRMRWLSVEMPIDLLVAAFWASREGPPAVTRVSLASPLLRQELLRGASETHLHGSSAIGFDEAWSELMGRLRRDVPAMGPKSGWPAAPADLGAILPAAAIARLTLAGFLRRRARGESFAQHLARWRLSRVAASLGVAIRQAWSTLLRRPKRAAVSPEVIRYRYAQLAGRDGKTLDPLIARGSAGGAASPDVVLACDALRHLASEEGRSDAAFALCFWQYVRARGLLFRALTVEPGTGGLGWFGRYFRRGGQIAREGGRRVLRSALRHDAAGLHLRSLELRARMPESSESLVRLARGAIADALDWNGALRGGAPTETGLVFCFVKERLTTAGGKRAWLHGAPPAGYGPRYASWCRTQRAGVRAMVGALRRHPELLLVVRGIDVASEELAIPLWVVAPLIDELRRESVLQSARCQRARPSWGVRPLRVTFHAGEEYRRLSEGVRRIHELIEFCALEPGDRIGHAIALAVDPRTASRRAGATTQPAEERLDDLLWELDLYARGALSPSARRRARAESEARALARGIYGADLDVHVLCTARRLRHRRRELERAGYPGEGVQSPADDDARQLLARYLTARAVAERGMASIEVAGSDDEVELLEQAQAYVRAELARLEIVIETNPSSNWLIGDMLAIDEHPAFRLQPLRGGESVGGPTVLVSINTDNPLTFATSLGDEFAHMYFALLRAGVASQDAIEWLGRVRENGVRSRFTLPASADTRALEELQAMLPRIRG